MRLSPSVNNMHTEIDKASGWLRATLLEHSAPLLLIGQLSLAGGRIDVGVTPPFPSPFPAPWRFACRMRVGSPADSHSSSVFSACLCCFQVWRNLSECIRQAAHHTEQVFPAHRNGFAGFLSALEAAEQVSQPPCVAGRGGECDHPVWQGRGRQDLLPVTLLRGHLSLFLIVPSKKYRTFSRQSIQWTQKSPKPRLAPCSWHSHIGKLCGALEGAGCVLTLSHHQCPNSPVSFTQIIGFGSALLEEVDPNPANFVGAGIIHTKTTQIGCLLRLEPNLQAQVRPLMKLLTTYKLFYCDLIYTLCNT